MSYRKFKGHIEPVMDLDYDLSCAFHTPETLRKKFRLLADRGFRRINIVVPPPDQVDYTHAGRISYIPEKKVNSLAASRREFRNPMREAVALARAAGLGVQALFKPYEGGGFFTIPVGHRLSPPRPQVDCLGGATNVVACIADHPAWRVQRRKEGPLDRRLPVTRIACAFLLDALRQTRVDGTVETRYPALSDAEVRAARPWQAELYVSEDNDRYTRLELKPTLHYEIKSMRITDANGLTLLRAARCLVITLSGFSIPSRFLAVRFYDGAHRLLLIPHSMVQALHGRRVLQTTVSPTYRYWPCLTREYLRQPPVPGDFRSCGFEFAECCPNDWRDWTIFGMARGHEPCLRGCLCEAVPGVRRYWLDQIRTLIAYGCEGVDIRLPSHCSGAPDFIQYGFNREIVQAFRRRFRRDPGRGRADYLRIMRLRGEFFMLFLEEAAGLLREHGRNLRFHLRNCLCRPSLGSSYHENGFWAMPKILPDWKRIVDLSDRVILSDNLSERHYAGARRDSAAPIKRHALRRGKPVWAYCYLQQGHSFNPAVLNDYASDPAVEGLYLYEVVYNTREKDGIVEVVRPDRVRLARQHQALFDELLPGPRKQVRA